VKSEIKLKWVEALRSGDYAQAKGSLKDDLDPDDPTKIGYCCLGVLCELAVQEGGIINSVRKSSTGTYYYDEESGLLPYSVQQWAGFETASPEFAVTNDLTGDYEEYHWLTDLNDNGKTFAEMADLIEEHF
jgi:hypothetical protein